MIITAYQTLEDKDNLDEIETDGPYECRRDDAWLGFGYYFWDTNMDWAKAWGEGSYNKRGKEYVVGRCQLDLSKDCFDLMGNVNHQQDILQTIEVLKQSGKIKEDNKLILPNIIAYLKLKGLFPYKSIRAYDNYNKVVKMNFNEKRHEYTFINQRVQVCVIHLEEVILRPFKVIYPDKYLT